MNPINSSNVFGILTNPVNISSSNTNDLNISYNLNDEISKVTDQSLTESEIIKFILANLSDQETKIVSKSTELAQFEFKQLCSYLEQVIIPETDLNYSLRDYLIKVCYRCVAEQEEYSLEKLNALLLNIGMLRTDEYDVKEFNNNFKIIISDSQLSKKLYFQLIMQVGRDYFDMPLHKILSKEKPQNIPTEAVLRDLKLELDKLYAIGNLANVSVESVIDRIIFNEKIKRKYANILKKLKSPFMEEKSKIKIIESQYKNIQSNLINSSKVLDDFIRPDLGKDIGQFKDLSLVVDDYLFVKLKSVGDTYIKYLKTRIDMLEKLTDFGLIESRNVFKMGAKILKHPTVIKEMKNGNYLYKNISEDHSILEKEFQKDQELDIRTSFKAFISIFENLCTEYESISGEKSESDIHRSMAWLMFGEELDENKALSRRNHRVANKEKKALSIQNQNKTSLAFTKDQVLNVKEKKIKNLKEVTNPLISLDKKNEMPLLQEHEQILSQHSELIFDFLKDMKADLQSQCKVTNLSDSNFEKAKIHSKELRDHLQYASLNFGLFCKAILNQDLYAMGAIIPYLCFDQHLAIEQLIKHQITVKGMNSLPSHNLAELYSYSSCNMNSDQEAFIKDFSDAMLQVRYPIAWSDKIQNQTTPGPLKWMKYSQNLCQSIISGENNTNSKIDPTELMALCTFVFDSYQNTLKCLQQQLNPDLKIHSSIQKMMESFESLKSILELSIANNKEDLTEKSIKIKKSRSVSNEKNLILKTHQNLFGIGQEALKNVNIDYAIPEKILDEASNHLLRIDAVDYLQQNYNELQFAALHHRNLLMFQWLYEQLYRFNGYVAGLGELSWVCNHNLESFHSLVFPKESVPKALNEFNFGRNLHYSHEWGLGKSLSLVQELLGTRKLLKNLDPTDSGWVQANSKKEVASNLGMYKKAMSDKRLKILEKGKQLLQTIINATCSEKL